MKFRVYIRCRSSKKKKEKKKKKHVREVTISFDEEGEHSIYTHSRINVTGRRIVPMRQPHPIEPWWPNLLQDRFANRFHIGKEKLRRSILRIPRVPLHAYAGWRVSRCSWLCPGQCTLKAFYAALNPRQRGSWISRRCEASQTWRIIEGKGRWIVNILRIVKFC